MFKKGDQRSWIKFEVARGKDASECHHTLREACALPYRTFVDDRALRCCHQQTPFQRYPMASQHLAKAGPIRSGPSVQSGSEPVAFRPRKHIGILYSSKAPLDKLRDVTLLHIASAVRHAYLV
ncbi:hypothetical protein AVEN_71201-1 [Araneus ventricosus]|uniref:Uncharacterized protein n=1 Tax=Araneus ventricosus TaxID=182803 RepID=A0A4Y2HRS8_ARAVE|nr:hypothetical protein AVEN_71201-1 [Araneus ventricosus]